jgi:3-deoxy-manno-octulosonate cytidylyltransferase (CMP-KDO synthetase)
MLAPLGGKPLIVHTYLNVKHHPLLSEVIVATDSVEIQSVIEEFGGKAVLTSDQHISGTDRIAEVIQDISCDLVINIQGDEPFISESYISQLIEMSTDNDVLMATLAHPITEQEAQSPHNVKVILNCENNAIYFSRSMIPYPRSERVHTPILKHVGLYAYKKPFLLDFVSWPASSLELTEGLEQLRALERGVQIKVGICEEAYLGIDTEEDLNQAEEFLERCLNTSL